MTHGRPIGARKRRMFLEALGETAQVRAAIRAADVPSSTIYGQRARDPEFADAWDSALQIGLDRLEDEAVRRALDGNEEPVFYQGQQVGTVRKYSESLLTFLLKAHRPARYRERVGVEVGDDLKRLLEAVDGTPDGYAAGDNDIDDV